MGHLPILKTLVDSDIPMIDLDTENPFFTENRARMSFLELVAECERNYQNIAHFAEKLTEEQLGRKAHIPKMKDSPLGEYPTFEEMINGLGEYPRPVSHRPLSRDPCFSFKWIMSEFF